MLLYLFKKGRLKWFGHIEQKDEADFVEQCLMMQTDETSQRECPKKT